MVTREIFQNGVKIGEETYSPPAPPSVISYEAFQARFTATELDASTDFVYEIGLVTGKPKRPKLLQAFNGAVARNQFDLLAPSMATWMDALVTATILTQARRDQILDPAVLTPPA